MTSEATKKQYDFYLKRLESLGSPTTSNVKKNVETIEAMTITPVSKRSYYVALAYATRSSPAIHAEYKKRYETINKAIKADKTAKPKATPWATLQALGRKFVSDPSEPIENRILIGLVTQDIPARLDYTHLKILPTMPKDHPENYIHLAPTATDSHLVIVHHKTERTYGTLTREIPANVHVLLKQWNADHPGGELFAISENALGKYVSRLLERMTGEHLTMNDLRHSFVTTMRKGDKSKDDVEAITDKLGHSLSTNYLYRRE